MEKSETHSETHIDKSTWGDGPWQKEPDRKEWRDKETGLNCMAIRNIGGGVWCGYVGVSSSHPAYGKDYYDVDVDVHGGLTYANKCSGKICHVPEPGEPDDIWWLGFDCGHCFDFAPAMVARLREIGSVHQFNLDEIYRDLEYVEEQCTKLASQLAAIVLESPTNSEQNARSETA